jgi:transposase
MSLSKQELFDRIRRDSWQRQMSIRALSKKYGVHRRLVREALSSPVPTPRRRPVRTSPRMEPYKKTVGAWLRADLEAPRKQRHTVRRIVARIEEEFGEAIPYPTVRDFVAARRKEIAAQTGAPVAAFVTLHNVLGADAEVDFGDVYVDLAGQRTRCYLFAFRLAYSGKAVHRISRSCGQQSFFEGHVHALTTLGGVPAGQVRYDNLAPAVKKVVFHSRSREENPRWTAFHEYYGFTPFCCEPGLRGAHERGGVEGQVGYFRRNYLTPVPQVDSLDELNAQLAEFEAKEDERRIGARMRTIAQDFAREAGHLLPLPDDPFTTGITLTPRVDRCGLITVKMCPVLRPGPLHRPQGHCHPHLRRPHRL